VGAGLRSGGSGGPTAHGEGALAYVLIRSLVRLLLALFYERIEVVGAEHIPARGPLIVVANHHNSVVDAMLLIAVVPRRLHTLANAPLFRHPLIGPFLRLLGALPVHRRQEAGDNPARNAGLFTATTTILRGGGAILIFPEGRTQPEPMLLPLRTGTARMLLAAEEGPEANHVTLLPVGLVFHEPGTFRTGRALALIGASVSTGDCLALARVAPEEAVRTLTGRMAAALREQIVEVEDRRALRLLGLVEELWRDETGATPRDEAARVAWLRRATQAYRCLLERVPARVAVFQQQLETFARKLEEAGLAATELSREYSPRLVIRFALREGFSLLVGAPLALCGIVAHLVPYRLTAAVVRRLRRTEEEEATDKIVVGLVLYPLAWAAEGWGFLALGGGGALAVFLVALLPLGFVALAWRQRLDHLRLAAGAFLHHIRDPSLLRGLREDRKALAGELVALAGLVPEVWPTETGSSSS
jgi:glycerol-3-phosphate O-acyltransferase/dihydroxyacetone phosphate acyltransferase